MMDKTIRSSRTPKNLDLVRLSKKMNKVRNDNLDLIKLQRKPNRLRRARTTERGSPIWTKSLKPRQFKLTCEQHKKNNINTQKNTKI
jgi:hypothetical protein